MPAMTWLMSSTATSSRFVNSRKASSIRCCVVSAGGGQGKRDAGTRQCDGEVGGCGRGGDGGGQLAGWQGGSLSPPYLQSHAGAGRAEGRLDRRPPTRHGGGTLPVPAPSHALPSGSPAPRSGTHCRPLSKSWSACADQPGPRRSAAGLWRCLGPRSWPAGTPRRSAWLRWPLRAATPRSHLDQAWVLLIGCALAAGAGWRRETAAGSVEVSTAWSPRVCCVLPAVPFGRTC
jgi:hypothetical protein